MTLPIIQAIEICEDKLRMAGIYSPESEARQIVAHVLGFTRDELDRRKTEIIFGEDQRQLNAIISRRMKREPLARIIGSIPFGGITLDMAAGVFEPMVESETLVEHAVLHFEKSAKPIRVLDVGTGSGAMLLATLHALPTATGVGVDKDAAAIKLAQANAEKNQLQARAVFKQNDLAANITEKFDLVLANVPFVPTKLIPKLLPEVRSHNPQHTLDGGKDGMDVYRQLAKQLPAILKNNGVALFQVTLKSANVLTGTVRKAGFRNVAVLKNTYGVPVAVEIKNSEGQGKGPRKSWLSYFTGKA